MHEDENHSSVGVVLKVVDLPEMLDFLTQEAGLRVEKIHPADSPTSCSLSGSGCRVHLEVGTPQPVVLRLETSDPGLLAQGSISGPEGLSIEYSDAAPPMILPPLVSSPSLSHEDDSWHTGRAGMLYRDLVPDRQGGAVIASQIRVPGSGPVPDYVHFHEIAFQLIFCRRGTVRVVYEDQGEPFELAAGDCVTQPPRIRHRVLESAGDLEVIEIGYPAEHITRADPSTRLPTSKVDTHRTWDGQVFVHHRRSKALPETLDEGVTRIETGVFAGTQGLADVAQIDLDASTWTCPRSAIDEFVMLFVLEGEGEAHLESPTERWISVLRSGTTLVVPVEHCATISPAVTMSLLMVRIDTARLSRY